MPIKPAFDFIKSSPYPFIFLGYDGLNDVFVCWNYHIAKERLNVGKSVSFYSRTFFQSEVKEGEFIRRKLKNGDIPVLFKRSDLIEFFEKIDTFFPTENISRLNYDLNISNHNYEVEFKEYLKFNKKLSDKSIKNYANALKGRISEGLKKHFISSLESIYFIDSVSILDELNVKLFEKEEYKELNITGKNMYSCAFDNYISFINSLSIYEVVDVHNEFSDVKEEYCKGGKLLKITDIDLINQIQPLIDSNRLLSAAQIVGKYYENQYLNMELSDWINLVRKI